MKKTVAPALVLLGMVGSPAEAATYSLLAYYTDNSPATQDGSDLWTFQKSSASGAYLVPSGTYYLGDETNAVPLSAGPYAVGSGFNVLTGLAGVFAHPGHVAPLAIVFRPQGPTLFGSITVFNDMIDNGSGSNGIGVSVFYTKDSVTSQLGSRYVFDHASTAQPISNVFELNSPVTLNLGDTVEVRYDNNGSALFDHSITEIVISEVPEPASLSLLGLGGLVLARRRRG